MVPTIQKVRLKGISLWMCLDILHILFDVLIKINFLTHLPSSLHNLVFTTTGSNPRARDFFIFERFDGLMFKVSHVDCPSFENQYHTIASPLNNLHHLFKSHNGQRSYLGHLMVTKTINCPKGCKEGHIKMS